MCKNPKIFWNIVKRKHHHIETHTGALLESTEGSLWNQHILQMNEWVNGACANSFHASMILSYKFDTSGTCWIIQTLSVCYKLFWVPPGVVVEYDELNNPMI